jgi:hypothetical protein
MISKELLRDIPKTNAIKIICALSATKLRITLGKQMNKASFLQDSNVIAFIGWCKQELPRLQVNLDISRSRFVPEPINTVCKGLDEVLLQYIWKAADMQNGSWNETVTHLAEMGSELRHAVNSGNDEGALLSCKRILRWGGNRNYQIGAYPFLSELSAQGRLCEYIQETGKALSLETANLNRLAGPGLPLRLMNSMLTKVHAFYSEDGLPIYDSRVAAAVATLIELWRQDSGCAETSLPEILKFPATTSTRTVLDLFPEADHPGVMVYGHADTVIQWSSAKVCLGWLMEAILNDRLDLFNEITSDLRMRAFEASLFMMGYDVACLGDNTSQSKKANKSVKKLQKRISQCTLPALVSLRQLTPLSGNENAQKIRYTGDIENGFDILWGSSRFFLDPEVLEELQGVFGELDKIPLGAEQSGKGPINSLGVWLNNAHKISPRWASAIAPILVDVGLIKSYKGKKPIFLNFA